VEETDEPKVVVVGVEKLDPVVLRLPLVVKVVDMVGVVVDEEVEKTVEPKVVVVEVEKLDPL
jgi:hypothetical protein